MRDPDALLRFHVPAAFIIERAMPTAEELAYGFEDGWITVEDVVALALAKYTAGLPCSAIEEELALLLSDDIGQVEDLVGRLAVSDVPSEERASLWLYLALAWLREHPDMVDDDLQAVECLYADFEYPPQMGSFVRFQSSESDGGLRRRWDEYLTRRTAELASRQLT